MSNQLRNAIKKRQKTLPEIGFFASMEVKGWKDAAREDGTAALQREKAQG
jgi:hypothetical protein